MRKLIFSLAAAGTALAFATPAAAQYFPGQPYGYGFGSNNYGQVRILQARVDALQNRIQWLDRRNRISDRQAHRLRDESYRIEHRLRDRARYGLNPYEANDIQRRVSVLEQQVQFASSNRWGGYGWNGYNGYNSYYANRDEDRYERDHDRWHENHDGDDDDDNDDD